MALNKKIRQDRWFGIAIAFIFTIIISILPPNYADWFEFHCPHRLIFGFGCPLCGSTRAMSSIFHLNFYKALSLNPAIYALIIFGFFEVFNLLVDGEYEKARRWLIISTIISYILVYIYRIYSFMVS